MRTYDLKAGRLDDFLSFYEKNGLAIQRRVLGGLLCYLVSDIGPLNQVVHLWRYASLSDRERRRRKLLAEPGWASYLEQVPCYVERMRTQILRSARFCPALTR
jgi:hypothetical protein